MTEITTTSKRTLHGEVVSASMTKTIVVRVDRMIPHPKYKKRVAKSQRFAVHDEKSEYKVGDQVTFVETRPLSRTKRWRALPKATVAKASK